MMLVITRQETWRWFVFWLRVGVVSEEPPFSVIRLIPPIDWHEHNERHTYHESDWPPRNTYHKEMSFEHKKMLMNARKIVRVMISSSLFLTLDEEMWKRGPDCLFLLIPGVSWGARTESQLLSLLFLARRLLCLTRESEVDAVLEKSKGRVSIFFTYYTLSRVAAIKEDLRGWLTSGPWPGKTPSWLDNSFFPRWREEISFSGPHTLPLDEQIGSDWRLPIRSHDRSDGHGEEEEATLRRAWQPWAEERKILVEFQI